MSYRRRLNFTLSGLEEASLQIDRICALIEHLRTTNGTDNAEKLVTKSRKQFEAAMNDNLNTGKALKIMQELVEEVNKIYPDKKSSEKILGSFRIFDSILGLQLFTSA